MKLHLDSKKRITISKLLPSGVEISSVFAHKEGNKIILELMTEIPADELWVHENPKILAAFKKGLSEEANIDLGSFGKHARKKI